MPPNSLPDTMIQISKHIWWASDSVKHIIAARCSLHTKTQLRAEYSDIRDQYKHLA